MALALFDILTDEYKHQDFNSIKSHLARLLNARQGSLTHMPDYGLPDVAEIFQGLPYTTNLLVREITNTINKYEPRLKAVRVIPKTTPEKECVLQLEITGTTTENTKLHFDTYFLSGGVAEVM